MSEIPIYQSIALDIAQRIASGEIAEGSKISGRTLLASHYHVSPETIRKAIGLLKAELIVEVSQGKEVVVLSQTLANEYLDKYQYMKSVFSYREQLELLLQEKRELDRKLEEVVSSLIHFSDRLRNLAPFHPVEVTIPPGAHVVGKSIADIKLWQHTQATLIALRRGSELTISPGSHVILRAQDGLILVGDEQVLERTELYFHQLGNKEMSVSDSCD